MVLVKSVYFLQRSLTDNLEDIEHELQVVGKFVDVSK